MRQSLTTLALAATLAGGIAVAAAADDTTGQPQKLTPGVAITVPGAPKKPIKAPTSMTKKATVPGAKAAQAPASAQAGTQPQGATGTGTAPPGTNPLQQMQQRVLDQAVHGKRKSGGGAPAQTAFPTVVQVPVPVPASTGDATAAQGQPPAAQPAAATDPAAATSPAGVAAAPPQPAAAVISTPHDATVTGQPQSQAIASQTTLGSPAPAAPAAPAPSAPAAGSASAPSCLPEIAKAERRYHIPDGLLVAIALVESGRADPDTGVVAPWPWTINSHGEGEYFDSIDDAAKRTAQLLTRNNDGLVDVGCMQVDLYHHPHAFQTLLAAFDPETNVDYAAQFLVDLKQKNGSWFAAVAAYNAGDPHLGAEYVARVLYYWKELGLTEAAAQAADTGAQKRGYIIEARPTPLEIAAGFIDKQDYAAAVTIYRAVLRDSPDDQTAMLGLAHTLHETGHDDEARQQLERVLTENPNSRPALFALLEIIDTMAPPQRLTALLSARQVAPTSAQIPARIAMIEESRGNLKDAIAQMGSAVRLAPADPVLQLDYALLLDHGGFRTASVEAYAKFLQMYQPGTVMLTVPIDQIRRRLSYLRQHVQ